MTEKTVYILVSIGGVIALFEPYFTSRIKKQRFEYKDHLVKIIFGFVALSFGGIKTTIEFSKADPPPLFNLFYDDSEIWLSKNKDSLLYDFWFRKGNSSEVYNINIDFYSLCSDNRYPNKIKGHTSTDMATLAQGTYMHSLGFFHAPKTFRNDTAYIYIRGSYTNYDKTFKQTFEHYILWYPGVAFVASMDKDKKQYFLRGLKSEFPNL